jgi:hypothetical protein
LPSGSGMKSYSPGALQRLWRWRSSFRSYLGLNVESASSLLRFRSLSADPGTVGGRYCHSLCRCPIARTFSLYISSCLQIICNRSLRPQSKIFLTVR